MSAPSNTFALTKARLLNCTVETRTISLGKEVEITAPTGFCMSCDGEGLHSIIGRCLGAPTDRTEEEMWEDLNQRMQHGIETCRCQDCVS